MCLHTCYLASTGERGSRDKSAARACVGRARTWVECKAATSTIHLRLRPRHSPSTKRIGPQDVWPAVRASHTGSPQRAPRNRACLAVPSHGGTVGHLAILHSLSTGASEPPRPCHPLRPSSLPCRSLGHLSQEWSSPGRSSHPDRADGGRRHTDLMNLRERPGPYRPLHPPPNPPASHFLPPPTPSRHPNPLATHSSCHSVAAV